MSYSWINEIIISVKIRTGRNHCNIIGVYAPVEGERKNSEIFYKSLQECINKTGKNDYSLVVGDLNARVGRFFFIFFYLFTE